MELKKELYAVMTDAAGKLRSKVIFTQSRSLFLTGNEADASQK